VRSIDALAGWNALYWFLTDLSVTPRLCVMTTDDCGMVTGGRGRRMTCTSVSSRIRRRKFPLIIISPSAVIGAHAQCTTKG
jgi:hypothetical protein